MTSTFDWYELGVIAEIANADAQTGPLKTGCIISTDPPYYDNIGYADLSDFFYVWLKSSLSTVWPNLFRRVVTPKDEELVATADRHGGKNQADAFFMKGMQRALRSAATPRPMSILCRCSYAFKQSEAPKTE